MNCVLLLDGKSSCPVAKSGLLWWMCGLTGIWLLFIHTVYNSSTRVTVRRGCGRRGCDEEKVVLLIFLFCHFVVFCWGGVYGYNVPVLPIYRVEGMCVEVTGYDTYSFLGTELLTVVCLRLVAFYGNALATARAFSDLRHNSLSSIKN